MVSLLGSRFPDDEARVRHQNLTRSTDLDVRRGGDVEHGRRINPYDGHVMPRCIVEPHTIGDVASDLDSLALRLMVLLNGFRFGGRFPNP